MDIKEELKKYTNEFFEKHWCIQKIQAPPPQWSQEYYLKGCMPNHDKQGVYAFLTEKEVIYIGVGASRGSGRYRGHGLGKRIQGYTRCIGKDLYEATDQKLKDADSIVTLGFEQEYSYLALALESFLISRLSPKYNKNVPGS
ncbi:MAG TPA: hypothetical protein ENJ28_09420 [Gammaproteobacteria bacterium]|nr:hypothetical protein [Gammaproteobacteria bacterium]